MPPEISYDIRYPEGSQDRIAIRMDDAGRIDVDADYQPPEWARLSFHQCSHCTLDPETHAYCPIARNIAFLFPESFSSTSWQEVTLTVTSDARHYSAETTLQRALGSLFGLICSLSDCPHTRVLKPMGIFHLPLSTDRETLVRAASFFLLKRYLEHLRNPEIMIDLSEMETTYKNLKILNRGLAQRFRGDGSSDAVANAFVLLDILVRDVDFELEDQLDALHTIFATDEVMAGELVND